MSHPKPHEYWTKLRETMHFHGPAFIDGRYVASASGKVFDCISPIDGQVLTTVAACEAEDVDRAVAAARRSFKAGVWSRMPPAQRKQTLIRLAENIRAHIDELALLETLDMGKPIADSATVDIPGAAHCINWYGESLDKLPGELAPTGPESLGLITREPLGVVAAIVPWNFPLLMAALKIGPALAVGNSVVLKPSEKSPLTAVRVAELAAEAGMPEGVFNVVPGFGDTAGKALGLHDDVDCVAFTGSTRVGRLMLQYAGQSNMKRVWLECGGKTPNIVLADCPNLDVAAQAAWAMFFNQGEMCSADSRLLVQTRIKDQFVEKVLAAGRRLQPGDPLDPESRLGAIVDDAQMNTILRYVKSGKGEGARLRLGGKRVRQDTGGYYVAPTVFDEVKPAMTIAREEISGPVLSTLTFTDLEEAVAIANDTIYGLAAAVWTGNLRTAHEMARRLRAGTVWINCLDEGDMTVPFGGDKQPGFGRDKWLHAIDKYVELKTTWVNLTH
ncbi:MAG: aldehyde dehydrogenase [Chromatiales bacterium]